MHKRQERQKHACKDRPRRFFFDLRMFLIAGLLIVTVIAYIQSFSHQFVIDDHHLLGTIVAGMRSSLDAWQSATALKAYYRPLFFTSLYFDYRLFGQWAAGYHAVNLLLHGLAVWCAFLLAARLLKSSAAAALAALLFALHPSHTENVSWISGRTDLLSGIFIFLSLAAFYDLLVHKKTKAVFFSPLFFLLGIFSKEVAFIVPPLCGIMLLILKPEAALKPQSAGRMQKARSGRSMKTKSDVTAVWIWGVFVLFLICAIVFMLLRLAAAKEGLDENTFMALADRLMNAIRCYGLYIRHAISGGGYEYIILGWRLPDPRFNLALPADPVDWAAIGAAILGFCTVLLIALRGRRAAAVFGLSGFFLSILPVAGFVPLHSFFSVRFLYMPVFFLALAAVDICRWSLERAGRPLLMRIGVGAALACALCMGIATFLQDRNWHDDVTLLESMQDRAAASPRYYFCLGNGYRYRGDLKQAVLQFETAVERYPGFYEANMNLGTCLMILGEQNAAYYAQAVAAFSRAAGLFPNDSRIFMMLGDALLGSGNESEAVRNFLRAYSLDKSPEVLQRLRALQIDPEHE